MASRRRRGGESSSEENLDDVFRVFDTAGNGKIPAPEVGTLIRASGKNPSQAEVESMIEECGGAKGTVTLDKFKELSRRKLPRPEDQEQEMRAAFAGLDRDGGGYVLEGELRGLLSSLGDALSSTELDQAMRAANVSAGGEVFYDDFVTNLCK